MNEAYLCLGGNLGNCIETFAKAIKMLERQAIRITNRSHLYIGSAWGMQEAPDFYNQVIAIETGHSAGELMKILLDTEKNSGRERNEKGNYQSRTLDIDLLFFNDERIQMIELEVPHPRLHLRRFVLEPLNEIAPDLIHPVLHKSISELLAVCEDKNTVKKYIHAI